jgi:hypothetical protein
VSIADACRFNPFEGDFGDPGDRELRDKIVTFRFTHDCCMCPATIRNGEKGRALTMLWADGSPAPVCTYRYCNACTVAMSKVFKDNGKALDARPVRRAPITAGKAPNDH